MTISGVRVTIASMELECYVRGKAESWQEKGDSEG